MSNAERMTVLLPGPMAERVRAAVDSGEYATTSDALADAVEHWSASRDFVQDEVVSLRMAWDEGIASGESEPLDMKSIIAEAKATRVGGRRG